MKKVSLLIIDPQYDFCDPAGSLFVPGAEADMLRLGAFMSSNAHKLADVQITLDSHHLVDIAHPITWVDSHGNHPNHFTAISADDVRSGKWRAFHTGWQSHFLDYVNKLEAGNRYPLMIWPPHCLIGTVGATIVKPVVDGMLAFEKRHLVAGKTTKGSNPSTEHYSAVKAEVEDPRDPSTKINDRLIRTLNNYDEILISGEALSHCVANTIRDIAEVFSDEDVKKFVLLTDTSSSVPGFEQLGTDFVNEMMAKGMRLSTTATYQFN